MLPLLFAMLVAASPLAGLAQTSLGSVKVGSASASTPVTVTITTAGTASGVAVLTHGSPNLDFAAAGGGSCASGAAYAAGGTCTVNVVFSPTVSGGRNGAVVLQGAGNVVLGTAYVQGTGTGPQLAFSPTTLAAPNTLTSNLSQAFGVAVDGAGNVYATDYTGHALYKETYSISGGVAKYTQTLLSKGFGNPSAVAVDGAGNLFVVDQQSPSVVELSLLPDGTYSAPAKIATFTGAATFAVAVDSAGNVFAVLITGSSSFAAGPYELVLSNGVYAAPVALQTPSSGWSTVTGVGIDGSGNVYVSNFGDGNIFEYALGSGGYAAPVSIGNVTYVDALTVDANGDVFAGSYTNPTIYEFLPAGVGAYDELQIAGSTSTASNHCGGNCRTGLAVDGAGNLYAASGNPTVLELPLTNPTANFTLQEVGTTSPPQTVDAVNIGNAPLTLGAIGAPTYFETVAASGNSPAACANGTALAPHATCPVYVEFDPVTAALNGNEEQIVSGLVGVASNAVGAAASPGFTVTGTAIAPPTTHAQITVTASPDPAFVGDTVGFAVTLAGSPGGAVPTGTVAFANGSTSLGTPVTLVNGAAAFSTTALPAGQDTITVSYSGDVNYVTGTATLSEDVITSAIVSAPPVTSIGTVAVGASSASPTSVTMTFSATAKLAGIAVLTQGNPNLDFTPASGGTCATGTTYQAGDTCTVDVNFTPQFSGTRYGAVVLQSGSYGLLGTAYLEGIGKAPQLVFSPGTLATAGAVANHFGIAYGLAVDAAGSVYVADDGGGTVYKESYSNSGGVAGYTQTTIGTFTEPLGVAVDSAGNVFVTTRYSPDVYEFTLLPNGTYTVPSTIASFTGVGGLAGIAVDGAGNVFVTLGAGGSFTAGAYEIPLSNGVYGAPVQLQTPGSGYSNPFGIGVDGNASVYVGNFADGNIFKYTLGSGGYGAPALIGNLTYIDTLTVDTAGDVYAGSYSGSGIAEFFPTGAGTYTTETINYGNFGHSYHCGVPSCTQALGLAVDGAGNLYVSTGNSTVFEYPLTAPSVGFGPQQVGSSSAPQAVAAINIGNQPLDLSTIAPSANFGTIPAPSGSPTACAGGSSLAASALCPIYINFTPTAASLNGNSQQPLTGAVTVTSDTLNVAGSTDAIAVTGTATIPTASITLTGSPNPGFADNPVTFTATVSATTGGGVPTGSVTFFNGATQLGSAVTLVNGVATYTTSALPAGQYTINATYSGDSNYYGSSTSALETVDVAPVTSAPPVPVATAPGTANAGEVAVGSSAPVTVTLTFSAPATLGGIAVLTEGTPGLDFTRAASSGSCAVGSTYAAGNTCTVNVAFTPKFAGPRNGAVVLSDSGTPAAVIGTAYLTGNGEGAEIAFLPGALSAPLNGGNPFDHTAGIAVDGGGDVFVADNGGQVLELALSAGAYAAPTEVGGAASYFDTPQSVAVDGAGNLYVADSGDEKGHPDVFLFKLQPGGGYLQYSLGSGWDYPTGVAIDSAGNLYVADDGAGTVVALKPSATGYASTTVASGLVNPWAIAVDSAGSLYVALNLNHETSQPGSVLKLTASAAGYTQSSLGSGWIDPNGISVDGNGNVYVADDDFGGGAGFVAKLTSEVGGGYAQTTIIPNSLSNQPAAVALDSGGNLYIVDSGAKGAFKLDVVNPPALTFATTPLGLTSSDSPQTVTVNNIGNQPLTFSAIGYAVDFPAAAGVTGACATGTPVTSNAACALPIDFTPTTSLGANRSAPLTEGVSISSNSVDTSGAQTISVSGTETTPVATEILASSVNPGVAGNSILFTATVSVPAGLGIAAPTGSVTFTSGGTNLCSAVPLTASVATCATAALATGSNLVVASYSGDTNYPANSATLTEYLTATAPPTGGFGDNAGVVNVGASSGSIPLTITFNAGETLGGIAVLTQGAANKDFTLTPGGSCAIGSAYAAAATCTVNINFTPRFAGPRTGAVVLTDASGNVLGTGYLQGIGTGAQTIFGVVAGTQPTLLDPGSQSTVDTGWVLPSGVAVDGAGNVYIADAANQTVVKETYSNTGGTVTYTPTTIDNGWGSPAAIAVDGAGNLYVADSGNAAVVKETLVNGSYIPSTIDTAWGEPVGIAVDATGNVYVSDAAFGTVTEEKAVGGTYLPSLVAKGFNYPDGVAVDGSGNVYVADLAQGNGQPSVYKETLSSSGYSQSNIGSAWQYPAGIAVDGNGNVYVADTQQGLVVKEAFLNGGYTPVQLGQWYSPEYLALDPAGNLYVTDGGSNGPGSGSPVGASATPSVYRLDFADTPSLSFATTKRGVTSADSPQTVLVENFGNAVLTLSSASPAYPADFPELSGVAFDCGAGKPVPVNGGCTLSIEFTPTASLLGAASQPLQEAVTVTSNALNIAGGDAQSITVSGTELANANGGGTTPQTIAFAAPASPLTYGVKPIKLSASASSKLPVTFTITAGSKIASLTGNTLAITAAGQITVTASQEGNSTYAAAPPVSHTITVTPVTLTLKVNNASFTYGGTLPAFSGTATGFVHGDSLKTDLSLAYSSTVPATSHAGSYPNAITATLGGPAAGGYTLSVSGGTLTIGKAVLSVTPKPASREYGAKPPSISYTFAGFVNGDSVSALTGSPSYTTTAKRESPVGTYPATATRGSLSAVNYRFTFGSSTLQVTPAKLVITAKNLRVVYGFKSLPKLTYTISGLEGCPRHTHITGTPTLTTTAKVGSPAGSYPITVSVVGVTAPNYIVTGVDGTLTVEPATLKVTPNNATRPYGAPLPTLTYTITGFVYGQKISVVSGAPALTTTATASSKAGTYPINAALGSLSAANYTFNFGTGTLTVTAVNTKNTATALSISPNTSTLTEGQAYILTATVTALSGVGTPSGNVVFSVGSSTATVALNSSGVATYSGTAPLTRGTLSLSAAYQATSSLNGSASNTLTEMVGGVNTTTALSITPNSPTLSVGQSYTLTATVAASSGSAAPGGNVVFTVGSSTTTVALNASGVATYTGTAPLIAGTLSLSAAYQGTGFFNGSSASALNESVVGVNTATVLSISPNGTALTEGEAYTLTATVAASSGSIVPGGNVIFTVGSSTTTVALNASGVAMLGGTAPATAGPLSISAAYQGTSYFNGSTSNTLAETVSTNAFLYEGFGYNPGNLAGNGGWTGPGDYQVRSAGLSFTDSTGASLAVSGGSATVSSYYPGGITDTLPQTLGGAGTTAYWSFIYTGGLDDSVSLLDTTGNAHANIDVVNGTWQIYLNGTFNNSGVAATGKGDFLVVRLDFSSTGTEYRLYVNPVLSGESANSPAVDLTDSFNGTLNAVNWYEAFYTGQILDEIRLGTNWASVTPRQ